MKRGSKQGEVSRLQETLNKLNFNTGIVDGWFGPITHKGVQMFQTANTLAPDGIVGPLTRGVLNNKCL
jgi:peptidoglycan hydrolase-like protein with peptidoglycan-binding domain